MRYVNAELEPVEVFLGLYETQNITGAAIAHLALDALLRLGLPVECLRGQAYDGASNMSVAHNGAQALITAKQLLAMFIPCSAHCVNLVTAALIDASACLRDALSLVNEIGVLSSQSGKFQALFKSFAADRYENVASLKPLCAWKCP